MKGMPKICFRRFLRFSIHVCHLIEHTNLNLKNLKVSPESKGLSLIVVTIITSQRAGNLDRKYQNVMTDSRAVSLLES
ncbi:MAG TPA: hypothetical protein DD473_06340 [Planctomycetaceae bacterium]|nr:hypothetical protein [Planctomycetaceae bacterium]|tara:strand:+ start:309 stop:542 length:234 start_codon:yes stop_codon:yes gene_type:complete